MHKGKIVLYMLNFQNITCLKFEHGKLKINRFLQVFYTFLSIVVVMAVEMYMGKNLDFVKTLEEKKEFKFSEFFHMVFRTLITLNYAIIIFRAYLIFWQQKNVIEFVNICEKFCSSKEIPREKVLKACFCETLTSFVLVSTAKIIFGIKMY